MTSVNLTANETELTATNRTATTTTDAYQSDRNTTAVLLSVFVIVGVHIAASMSVYQRRVTRLNRDFNVAAAADRTTQRFRRENTISILLLLSSALSISRYAVEAAELHYGHDEHPAGDLCTALCRSKAVLWLAARTCIYIVMWLRQRNFNHNLSVQGVANKALDRLGTFVLCLLLAAFAACTALLVAMREYRASPRGCVMVSAAIAGINLNLVTFLSLFLYTIIVQLLLLTLLVFPLLQHRRSIARMDANQRLHMKFLRRLTVCTFVAIGWNGFLGGVSLLALNASFTLYQQCMYDLDNLVLLLCVVTSFSDWRDRVLPCCVITLDED